jgi:butyrate kinase
MGAKAMERQFCLVVINIGSTSTKAAVFRDAGPAAQETISYTQEELARYPGLAEQLPRREKDLLDFLARNSISTGQIDIVVSRGGLGCPSPAGAYNINGKMCDDLLTGRFGKHPSALGPAMAFELAKQAGKPAIVIDPPSTDEFEPLARFSGIPEFDRKSGFHALNQKAAARRAARNIRRTYEEVNFVVAHLGGGITVGAHRKGRVIDCTHGLTEGPFTPERAGGLPTSDLLDWSASVSDRKKVQARLVGQGGLAAYLNTNDARKVEEMVKAGDQKAGLTYRAMAYQVAKEIGSMATVLRGDIDGIVLTGGLAFSEMLTGWISESVKFIAPVFVFPGEDEMAALAEGGLRVLKGEEKAQEYVS